jgi:hypothetical protein
MVRRQLPVQPSSGKGQLQLDPAVDEEKEEKTQRSESVERALPVVHALLSFKWRCSLHAPVSIVKGLCGGATVRRCNGACQECLALHGEVEMFSTPPLRSRGLSDMLPG